MKKFLILIGALALVTGVTFFFFKENFLTISVTFDPQKESYAVGDEIIIETTVKNYAPWTFKKTFPSNNTGPMISNITTNFSPTDYVMIVAGMIVTEENIKPFGSKTFSNTITLTRELELDQYGTGKNAGDILVETGENIIAVDWVKNTEVIINVE